MPLRAPCPIPGRPSYSPAPKPPGPVFPPEWQHYDLSVAGIDGTSMSAAHAGLPRLMKIAAMKRQGLVTHIRLQISNGG